MFNLINYFQAKERLKESIKTIEMMGGEDECQPMLLGQRDFLMLEVDYYQDAFKTNCFYLLTATSICVILYFINNYFRIL
jgi:hypothetical protein